MDHNRSCTSGYFPNEKLPDPPPAPPNEKVALGAAELALSAGFAPKTKLGAAVDPGAPAPPGAGVEDDTAGTVADPKENSGAEDVKPAPNEGAIGAPLKDGVVKEEALPPKLNDGAAEGVALPAAPKEKPPDAGAAAGAAAVVVFKAEAPNENEGAGAAADVDVAAGGAGPPKEKDGCFVSADSPSFGLEALVPNENDAAAAGVAAGGSDEAAGAPKLKLGALGASDGVLGAAEVLDGAAKAKTGASTAGG